MRDISFPENFSEAAGSLPAELFSAGKTYAATGEITPLVTVGNKIGFVAARWWDERSNGGVSISNVSSEVAEFSAACSAAIANLSEEPTTGEVQAAAFGDRLRNLGKLKDLFDGVAGAIGNIDPEQIKKLIGIVTTIVGLLG